MAEILIKGMDMLPEGCAYDVRIRGNGDVVDRLTGRVMGHAIEVPTHGRLIDASSEIKRIKEMQNKLPDTEEGNQFYYKYDEIIDYLYDAKTVIEAST